MGLLHPLGVQRQLTKSEESPDGFAGTFDFTEIHIENIEKMSIVSKFIYSTLIHGFSIFFICLSVAEND